MCFAAETINEIPRGYSESTILRTGYAIGAIITVTVAAVAYRNFTQGLNSIKQNANLTSEQKASELRNYKICSLLRCGAAVIGTAFLVYQLATAMPWLIAGAPVYKYCFNSAIYMITVMAKLSIRALFGS